MFFTTRTSAAAPTYKEIRACGRALMNKVLDGLHRPEFDTIQAARRMTLPTSGKTLIFAGQTDMNAFADFCLLEHRAAGQRLLDHCDPAQMGLSALETEILQAMLESRTSLFEAVAVELSANQVELRDLLEPQRPNVMLTDIGLSETLYELAARVVMFMRVAAVRNFNVSGGFFFLFNVEDAPRLLQSYRHRMKKVAPADWSEQKFVCFYRLHRRFGAEQMGAEVGYTNVT